MNLRDRFDSPLIETDRLAGMFGAEDLRILDCSVTMQTLGDGSYTFAGAREEWAAGHVPGSVFVDVLADLKDREHSLPLMLPSAAEFAAVMGSLGVGEGTRVVLYDRSNHAWAARVWWMLRVFGFDEAAVLNGGWQKWRSEGRPVSQAAESYPRARFAARFRPELVADKQAVLDAIGVDDARIVNALSPEEHRGAAATRFPRAGRVAGSVNVYCQSLIDPETHAYLPAAELENLFAMADAIGPARTITYCGAGIAASSDALVLTLLGAANVAVYDGSMAEWASDPSLPMETG